MGFDRVVFGGFGFCDFAFVLLVWLLLGLIIICYDCVSVCFGSVVSWLV